MTLFTRTSDAGHVLTAARDRAEPDLPVHLSIEFPGEAEGFHLHMTIDDLRWLCTLAGPALLDGTRFVERQGPRR